MGRQKEKGLFQNIFNRKGKMKKRRLGNLIIFYYDEEIDKASDIIGA